MRRNPRAAGGAEPLDIRLAEILVRPVFRCGQVALDEAVVVFLGKGLIRNQRDRVGVAGPFPADFLVAQPGDRASLAVESRM
jgi:hypothetical protein